MLDKKRRFFRLVERYVNGYRGKAVQEFYGPNSKIKVHSITNSVKENSIMLEVVVMLGEIINEETMDESMAHVLIQESMVFFFPECNIRTYVRFDV
jgi:hypothetical protein